MERALPFGIRVPAHPTSPLPGPNGNTDVRPQQPASPPSLGTWARAEFFSPAREACGPGLFAPGCGAAPGHMGRLYDGVAGSGGEEGQPGAPPTLIIPGHSFVEPGLHRLPDRVGASLTLLQARIKDTKSDLSLALVVQW